jgi:hypothetical protein
MTVVRIPLPLLRCRLNVFNKSGRRSFKEKGKVLFEIAHCRVELFLDLWWSIIREDWQWM